MKRWLAIGLLCLPAFGQATYKGGRYSGTGNYGVQGIAGAGENFYCPKGAAPEMTEGTPLWGATDDIANLPTACMYTGTDATPSPGNVYAPASSSALTNVLASANGGPAVNADGTTGGALHYSCGDVVTLAAGTVYVGPFNFPSMSCDGAHWMTVKTSSLSNANFPSEGVRATPCIAGVSNDAVNGRQLPGYPDYPCASFGSTLTAQIKQGPGANDNAITFASGANHYRFIGIEVAKDPTHKVGKLIISAVDGLTLGINHIIFDRGTIHGDPWTPSATPANESQDGFGADNSNWIALINSWDYDTYCNASCIDSHAFGAGTGLFQDGPFKLYNNLMATAGESWLFGGGGHGPGTPNTQNVEIRLNHSFKPLTWMVPINTCPNFRDPIPKNLGEFKNLISALLEGNVYENSWQGCQSDQNGFAQLLNPGNQNTHQQMLVNFDGSNVVVAADSNSFTHNTGGSLLSGNPVDAVNCPPGGCILGDIANSINYRFCDGVNGCDQSGISNLKCGTGVNAGLACTTNGQCPGSYCAPTTTARLTTAVPAAAGASVNACVPGECPSCKNQDITWRFNEVYNVTEGLSVNTGLSSICRDQGAGMQRISVHDNLMHGLSREMSNGSDPYSESIGVKLSNNALPPSVIRFVTVRHNTIAVETGNQSSVSGFGNQIDHSDIQYLEGLAMTDNVSPAAWSISRSSGTGVSQGIGGQSGLAFEYAVDACQRYFTNEAPSPDGIITTDGTQNFTFAGLPSAGTNYFASFNGQYTAVTAQTATSFSVTAATHAGDTIVVRDLNVCNWTFASNLLGKGVSANFQGSGQDQSPYPNPNSCGAGNVQPCILDETAVPGSFINNFVSWGTGRDGDFHIANSSAYKNTASDASSRPPTGKSPGADLDLLAQKAPGVRGLTFFPALTVTTTTLPAGTRNVAYNAALQSSFGASQFWAGYKGWFLETNPANCGVSQNCGSLNNGASHSGIIISRSGIINGPLALLNVSRTGCPGACLSTYTVTQTITGGAWEVGQTVTAAGMVNGTGTNNANDGTFNGTCVITVIGNNTFSCALTGGVNVNIGSHNPNTPKTCGVNGTAFCDATASFAPIADGTYSFWVGARDGAFQVARGQVTLTVADQGAHQVDLNWDASLSNGQSGCCTYKVYRSITSGTYGPASATGVDGTSFIDVSVSSGTTYYYVVTAFDGVAESIFSNEATAVVP